MPKLFGVDVSKDVWEFEGIDEKALLEKLNANRSGNEPKLSYDEMQQYFLNQKPSDKLSFKEKGLVFQHTNRLNDYKLSRIKEDVDRLKTLIRSEKEQQQKENAEKKENIEKNNEQKPEEKIEEKDEQKTNETGKNEKKSDEKSNKVENQENKKNEQKIDGNDSEKRESEKKVDQKAEEKKIDEKSDKEEEKKDNQKDETLKNAETEKKETEAKKEAKQKEVEPKTKEKLDVKEELEKEADKFAKNVEGVQAQQAEMAGAKKKISEERMQAFFNDLIDRAMMMQKGQLPKEQIPAYMQDMEALRELNKKQNGGIEEQLMQQRADNLQEIGEEYQKNREVTPKLVKKMDSLDAIDNILTGITRHPKLLFISLLLMGLNPLMAIGMAVMAAFGKSMVQDIYHNLPTAERAQLDQTQPQVQDQQASRDAQTEAYRKGMAEAKQQMNKQIEELQKRSVAAVRYLLDKKKEYEMELLAAQREKERMEKALAEKAAETSQKNADVKTKSAEVEKKPAEKTKEKESVDKKNKKDDVSKKSQEKKENPVLEHDNAVKKEKKVLAM